MSTRLEIPGPIERAPNRRDDFSSPYSTTDSPYSSACGAKTRSMLAVTATTAAWTQCAFGLLGFSSEAIGPAAAAIATVNGTVMITVQVSSAEVIWPTRTFSAGSPQARSADRASTGTIALDSAPPRISWYSRSGTWFAVTYAVPRQLAPTVWENTSVRTRPRTRDRIVRLATTAAPRATGGPSRCTRPGSVASARPVLVPSLGCACNSWSPCTPGLRPVALPSSRQEPDPAADLLDRYARYGQYEHPAAGKIHVLCAPCPAVGLTCDSAGHPA